MRAAEEEAKSSDDLFVGDGLKIEEKLDVGVLQTVRARVPFPPPPEQVTVQFVLDF